MGPGPRTPPAFERRPGGWGVTELGDRRAGSHWGSWVHKVGVWWGSGGLSPRRMGHSGEEVTGAGRRKWREMVVSGGPRAGQAGGCRAWRAWQGLMGHRDARCGKGHWAWEILAKVAGSGVTEPGDADERGGAGVAGPEYGQYLEVRVEGGLAGSQGLGVVGPGDGGYWEQQGPRDGGCPGVRAGPRDQQGFQE